MGEEAGLYRVDEAKILDYLLNADHPEGRSKAGFFMAMGFASHNWEDLRRALLRAPIHGVQVDTETTRYGDKAVFIHEIHGPNGVNRLVRTVWFRASSDVGWRLVSAYPDRKP